MSDRDSSLREIRLILSDVDGVLSDGSVYFDNQGIETKQFHIRDGLGITLWQKAGYQFGLVTSRTSQILKIRAAELGVSEISQGVTDKRQKVREIAERLQRDLTQICYIGDDLVDLPAMREVGLSAAPADATAEVREQADIVAAACGGRGAVREIIETILKAQKRWEELIRGFVDG